LVETLQDERTNAAITLGVAVWALVFACLGVIQAFMSDVTCSAKNII